MYISGEEIALAAMKNEFKILSRKAERARLEADEYCNVGTELIAIHKEFADLVESNEVGDGAIKKLDALKTRSEKAEKIRKKDLMKLLDAQSNSEITRDKLGGEIQRVEFRISLRKTG